MRRWESDGVHRLSLAVAVVTVCGGLLGVAGGLLGAVVREDFSQREPLPAMVSIPAWTAQRSSEVVIPAVVPVAADGSVSPILLGPDDDPFN